MGYTLSPTDGGPESLATAKQWTKNYREANPGPGTIKAHFFGADRIKKLLNEPGAVGIRIYYALNEEGEKKLLLVGTDKDGRDLLPKSGVQGSAAPEGEDDEIMDEALPCPPYCPPEDGDGLG